MRILALLLLIFSCAHQGTRAPAGWGKKWKISFEDHFNGRADIQRGVPEQCFSKTPTCLFSYSWRKDCPEFAQNLSELNKCNWDVYNYYNYMDQESPEGTGINAFDGSQVSIRNGNLVLSATRSPHQQFDCKRPLGTTPAGDTLYSRQCPFFSGAVDSAARSSNDQYGMRQKYGRWEVRAKIQKAPGAWPAIWLLPLPLQQSGVNAGCGWPHSGEVDILEFWSSDPKNVVSTYHSGDCPSRTHISKNAHTKIPKGWLDQFHTYAFEWNEKSMAFIVDNKLVLQVANGELDKEHRLPLIFPDNPLYTLLNLTIAKHEGGPNDMKPDPDNFPKQEMLVDYVKVYKECDGSEDPNTCVTFDTEDVVDQYNSEKGESAFAEVMTYPNPVRRGEKYKAKLMLKQYCQKARVQIYNVLGQAIGPNVQSGEGASGAFIYDGEWRAHETKEWVLGSSHLAAGMYFLTAKYERCGYDQKGKGNHVFKYIVL